MPGQSKRIRIFRWQESNAAYQNFGDEITIPLVDRLFGIEAIPAHMDEAELIGAGSILDSWSLRRVSRIRRLRERLLMRRSRNLHVWGSGFILPNSEAVWPQRLHFHAVRGRLTADRVEGAPTLGDPGILASLLLDRRPSAKHSLGLVPHITDIEAVRSGTTLPPQSTIIDPGWPVMEVVAAIGACELIVSSSLHGLIVADSFGIPCVWARSLEPLFGATDYKFDDYASSRGTPFNAPLAYSQALSARPAELAAFSTTPGRSMPAWQDELIAAFPHDL